MVSLQSYQLKKINGEIILDRTWENRYSESHTKQIKLCSLELMKLRQYLKDKKLNCITCDKINLDFEKGYVDCFRDKSHHVEIINQDPHILCQVAGVSRHMGHLSTYQKYYYCSSCDSCFKKTELNRPCCSKRLRHAPKRKSNQGRKLLRK